MVKSRNYLNYKCIFNEGRLRKVLLGLLVAAFASAPGIVYAKKHPAQDEAKSADSSESAAPVTDSSDNVSRYSYTFEELGALGPIELQGVDGKRSLTLSMRNDVVVTSAKLKISYAWSPVLIPELSHLKVMLNDELMTSLPLARENSNGHVSEIQLDPNMFVDYNKLTLGLIAHYTRECEDPLHSTLWANISNKSRIDITVRHLKLPNDLALLPAPFFDALDNRKLTLPIVFAEQPGNEVLQAAGVVASWFGSLSSYRGAQFPVLLNALPKGNGVVIVAGNAIPAGLNLPQINGASLAVVNNPLNANAKLLVIMGRDTDELNTAVQALTLGKSALTGGYASIQQLTNIPERKPYDAPNWIPTDRPVHLGELSKNRDLQVEGLRPDVIGVNFNIPPDIFAWRSTGVPLDLHYRYSPRPTADRSVLNVNINDMFVKALPLASAPGKLEKQLRLKLPLLENGMLASHEVVQIPHDNFYGRNQLQLHYYFDYSKQGLCKDVELRSERGGIDADSSIDFSAFAHYTAMPNLRFFVNDGFPFTRMADLSETAVVMPDKATSAEMETYLLLMGRMGNVTGYPAIRHAVIQASNVDANSNKDLIVIGTAGNQPLLERWADKMHLLLENGTHNLKLPGPFERLMSRWDDRDLEDAMHRTGDLIAKGDGQLGALVGFESPLKQGRSVVAFTGDNAEQIASLAETMVDPKAVAFFKGDLVMQSGKRIEGFQVGPTYYAGSLPWFTALRWYLSRQPLMLLLFVGLAALLVAVVSFRYLRKLAEQRLKN